MLLKFSLFVDIAFEFLYLILIIGALMTWIPRMPIDKPPFTILSSICEFFFAPFRKIIPPVKGIDFSPILAFIVLSIIWRVTVEILVKFGL